jgi:hypothetical protein
MDTAQGQVDTSLIGDLLPAVPPPRPDDEEDERPEPRRAKRARRDPEFAPPPVAPTPVTRAPVASPGPLSPDALPPEQAAAPFVRQPAMRRRSPAVTRKKPSWIPVVLVGIALLAALGAGAYLFLTRSDGSSSSSSAPASVAQPTAAQRRAALTRARVRLAESNLRHALTAAKGQYVNNSTYVGVTPATMRTAEPTLVYTSGPAERAGLVSVGTPTVTTIVFAARTADGACYFIKDTADQRVTYASAPSGSCDAGHPPTTFAARW